MTATQTSNHDARLGPRGTLAIGLVAALGALLSTPVVAMTGYLTFVPGLLLSIAAPGAFALVGLAAAAQSYRLDRTVQAVALAAVSVLFALIGTAYGLISVF